jgi:hypothetical protein
MYVCFTRAIAPMTDLCDRRTAPRATPCWTRRYRTTLDPTSTISLLEETPARLKFMRHVIDKEVTDEEFESGSSYRLLRSSLVQVHVCRSFF